jgi:polysaccharide deacetylase family protein (PEP-CTERM system associated)
LSENGIEFDSSIFPVHHDRYGIPDAEPFPYRVDNARGGLWEFPPSVYRVTSKVNLPVAGGGYFRLYPARLTIGCINRINRSGNPFMFYIHPWEVDPDQPRLPCGLRSRFRHYQNLASTHRKLDRLLGEIRFGTMTEVLKSCSCFRIVLSSIVGKSAAVFIN